MAVFLVINRWRSLELEQSKAELRVAVIIFRHKKVVKLSRKKYGFKMGFQAMLHHNGLIDSRSTDGWYVGLLHKMGGHFIAKLPM